MTDLGKFRSRNHPTAISEPSKAERYATATAFALASSVLAFGWVAWELVK